MERGCATIGHLGAPQRCPKQMTKIQFAYHFYFRNELKSRDTGDRYLGQAVFTTMENPPGPLVLESLVVQRTLMEAILNEYFNGTPVFRIVAPDGSYVTLDTALDFKKSRFQMVLKAPKTSEGGAEPSALMNYALQSQDQFQIAFTSGAAPEILETQYDNSGSQRALRAASGTDALVIIGALLAMLGLFWLVTSSGTKCGDQSAYRPYTGPLGDPLGGPTGPLGGAGGTEGLAAHGGLMRALAGGGRRRRATATRWL